jgi:hypothetical protein
VPSSRVATVRLPTLALKLAPKGASWRSRSEPSRRASWPTILGPWTLGSARAGMERAARARSRPTACLGARHKLVQRTLAVAPFISFVFGMQMLCASLNVRVTPAVCHCIGISAYRGSAKLPTKFTPAVA